MQCERAGDEELQGDKLELVYGEADVETRERVREHLAGCGACQDELQQLGALRRTLTAWRLPPAAPAFTPRGYVVPRWLAAAAVMLVAFGATLGISGYLSLRRALAVQEARAAALEQEQRASLRALGQKPLSSGEADALLRQVDARLEERVRASEAQQRELVDRRFADWRERAEVRRRVDMAQVAASLSYLDGRHGEQLARTNELMGYVLEASQKR